MRRGFKAWCEATSAEYRQTLGIAPAAALDPRRLAKHLGVRVTTPKGIPTLSADARRQLTVTDPKSWSAVTVAHGDRRLVILNSGHSPARQAISLAHELAHLILNHSSDRTRLSAQGVLFRGSFNRDQEEEADWLAGCLLVPRDGLLAAYRPNGSDKRLAARFGVSADMIRRRLRMTGVLRQMRQLGPGGPSRTAGTRERPAPATRR